MIFSFPESIVKRHIAVVGMTGSGKSSTARLLVEQIVRDNPNDRVCVLDPIKSDWWGITSSVTGKHAGLPFKILGGGPRAHVKFGSNAGKIVGQLIGNGKIPLSIIDMADFEPGGLQRFFVDFASSLWKNMHGTVHLVIEEAHEFAPKERAGIGIETQAIHWAKRFGTGSRTKGIRLIVATQRVQNLHNSVLGSAETVVVHRIGFHDDQVPVLKWLRPKVGKENSDQVEKEIANLPDGVGYIAAGAPVKVFERVKFPLFSTYDNTKTPDGQQDNADVKTDPVNREELAALIGEATIEAEANDPANIKKSIAEKDRKITELSAAITLLQSKPKIDQASIAAADKAGFERGVSETKKAAMTAANDLISTAMMDLRAIVDNSLTAIREGLKVVEQQVKVKATAPEYVAPQQTRPVQGSYQPAPNGIRAPTNVADSAELRGPEQRILNSLATWHELGHNQPRNAQVAWLAGYSPEGGSYKNPRGALRSRGLIEYPAADTLCLTVTGAAIAQESVPDDLKEFVISKLKGPEARILRAAVEAYPNDLDDETLASNAGYEAEGGSYKNPRGALRSKGLLDYIGNKRRAAEWLFSGTV